MVAIICYFVESMTPQDVAKHIQNDLPDTITTLPTQMSFFSETDEGVFECQPVHITSVVDSSGKVLCEGVVEGTRAYCNFPITEQTGCDMCFTIHAALYGVETVESTCVPVNIVQSGKLCETNMR